MSCYEFFLKFPEIFQTIYFSEYFLVAKIAIMVFPAIDDFSSRKKNKKKRRMLLVNFANFYGYSHEHSDDWRFRLLLKYIQTSLVTTILFLTQFKKDLCITVDIKFNINFLIWRLNSRRDVFGAADIVCL